MKRLNFKRSEIDKLMIVIDYVDIIATLRAFLFRYGQSADRLLPPSRNERRRQIEVEEVTL